MPRLLPEDGFEVFMKETEPRVRDTLSASLGGALGREATADAFAYVWEKWERVSQMQNPAGYVFAVGRDRSRRMNRWRRVVLLPVDDQRLPWVEPGIASHTECWIGSDCSARKVAAAKSAESSVAWRRRWGSGFEREPARRMVSPARPEKPVHHETSAHRQPVPPLRGVPLLRRGVESENRTLDDSVGIGDVVQQRVHAANPVSGLAVLPRMFF